MSLIASHDASFTSPIFSGAYRFGGAEQQIQQPIQSIPHLYQRPQQDEWQLPFQIPKPDISVELVIVLPVPGELAYLSPQSPLTGRLKIKHGKQGPKILFDLRHLVRTEQSGLEVGFKLMKASFYAPPKPIKFLKVRCRPSFCVHQGGQEDLYFIPRQINPDKSITHRVRPADLVPELSQGTNSPLSHRGPD